MTKDLHIEKSRTKSYLNFIQQTGTLIYACLEISQSCSAPMLLFLISTSLVLDAKAPLQVWNCIIFYQIKAFDGDNLE